MSDSEFFEAPDNFRWKAPEWIDLPVDEQIQYQVDHTRENFPDRKAIMVFTYDKNREPKFQKQVMEI